MNNFNLSNYLEEPIFIKDNVFFEQYISPDILHQIFNYLFDYVSDAIFLLDHNRRFIGFNKRLMQILQLDKQYILGQYFSITPIDGFEESRKKLFLEIEQRLKNHEVIDNLMIILPPSDTQVFAHIRGLPIQINEEITIYIGFLSDVSQQTKMESSLKNASQFDQLTGLQNRQNFFTFTNVFIRNLSNTSLANINNLALLRINIDKLQAFNASMGRVATDLILQSFVNRVKEIECQNCDIHAFARLGGDDFALLITAEDKSDLQDYLVKLQNISKQPFMINRSHVYVYFSVGVALFDHDTQTSDTLLQHADKALKQARDAGGNTLMWYDKTDNTPIFSKVHLLSEFTTALKEAQIVAFFQPKVSFKNNIPSFEALVRWQHPSFGILPPKEFLDEVLDGFSQNLFESIVNYCLAQVLSWKAQGFHVRVAVNVDVRQLWHEDFLPFITKLLQDYPNFAEHIEFELTETAQIHNHSQTLSVLNFLHDNHIKLSVDDFGTGYASLSYLIEYPVDTIKFDKIFIQNIDVDERKFKLVKSIIDMVHSIGVDVVAEGVETHQELALLQEIGCDITQGYIHGKPMPVDDATKWLRQYFS